MDYAQQLAQFGLSVEWSKLSDDLKARARDRLLDALSTSAGSFAVDVAPWRSAVTAFIGESDTEATGPATVVGYRNGFEPERAAFVNAVGVHSLLYEDISLSSSDHPGAVICPAALAAAEAIDAPMSEMLAAIVVGYETQLVLGALARQTNARGFRTTSVFGVVGAAAVGAYLHHLPVDQYAAALAFSANAAAGLMEAWAHGTFEPFLHAGAAASLGLFAVRLAQAGAAAAPTSFSGPNGYFAAYAGVPDAQISTPGETWRILDISCKPYPISGAKTTSVDSAIALLRGGVLPEQIESVEAWLPANAVESAGGDRPGPYDNVIQAQDSAQFCIAAALCGRPMDELTTFFGGFADDDIENLTHRMTLIPEQGRALGKIRVQLYDGSTHESEVDQRGNQVPTLDSMSRKLRTLADGVWSPQTATAIVDRICGEGNEDVSTLSALLRDIVKSRQDG
ncbi:MAG TPA: MmgE/PrpD family protein [Acidothermaceae bacterium]